MDKQMTQFDYLLNAFEHASQATRPAAEGYADKRKALFAYVRGLEAAAPPVDAQPVAVPEACKVLLREVMHNHRDKESPDYNACEDAQCMWCEEAAVFIAQPDAAPSPAPAAAAVSDEWNRAIESAARVCDSRELRAHTKSAAACYRLCAQGIRALTRPAPADASPAGDPTYTDDLELRYAEVCEERDHLRRALAKPAAPVAQPGDPMDWPLPCDVTVGHGTMRKGVKLSTLVRRMKVLYKMATGLDADEVANRSPEERQAIFDASPLSQFARRDGEAG